MPAIDQIEAEICAEFGLFDQWLDKYEYLIELGKKLPPLAAQHRGDENLVPGCQSRVWLHAELRDGRVFFAADSEAVITKGIIALLIRVLSGQPAAAISSTDLRFIETIGLREHLTPSRSNGLLSMVARIKAQARSLR